MLRERHKQRTCEADSIEALHSGSHSIRRGGQARSSDEAAVMAAERRGLVTRLQTSGQEAPLNSKAEVSLWEDDLRGSSGGETPPAYSTDRVGQGPGQWSISRRVVGWSLDLKTRLVTDSHFKSVNPTGCSDQGTQYTSIETLQESRHQTLHGLGR